MIEVKNLTKKYGDNTVVRSLDFTIEPGKIYGFLGPNGAGKSTTMNMITGCLAPTDGQVLIDGIDIFDDAVSAKRKIGYLPENPPVYPDMTAEEYLFFVAEAKGLRGKKLYEQVRSVMDETNILSMKDRLIKNLSKGYRQRVGIAQAMLGDPQVIILDEPTVGLDPKQITEIRELISRLGKTRTVVLSSHILAEVSAVCDHVMIINRGRLIASDTLDNIRRDNSPANRIELAACASKAQVEGILSGVKGVLSFELSENQQEGITEALIEAEEGRDIIEDIFFAFAEKRLALRRLAKSSPSLEEIFLSLTDLGYDEDSEYDDDDIGSDEDPDEDDTSDEQDAEYDEYYSKNKNSKEYIPLFGGKSSEEDEEE